MDLLIIVLRLVHILSGVFWVGGSLFTTIFVTPASAANGEAGQKFFAYLIRNARLAPRLAAAAGLTVLSGAGLYWTDSAGLTSSWTHSGPGRGFGFGAILGIIGFVLSSQVNVLARRIGSMASGVRDRPTQSQVLHLDAAQRRMNTASIARDVVLVLALACMATARYWHI